jgi:hypothetical protein
MHLFSLRITLHVIRRIRIRNKIAVTIESLTINNWELNNTNINQQIQQQDFLKIGSKSIFKDE